MLKKRVASRVFQDLTVPEIVARVLDVAGVPNTWKLAHSYAKRAYCVQYRESDFAFIARIAAEEGIFIISSSLRPAEDLLGAPPRPSALPRARGIDGRRAREASPPRRARSGSSRRWRSAMIRRNIRPIADGDGDCRPSA